MSRKSSSRESLPAGVAGIARLQVWGCWQRRSPCAWNLTRTLSRVAVSLALAVEALAEPLSEGIPVLVAIRPVESPPYAENDHGDHDPGGNVVVGSHDAKLNTRGLPKA